MYNNFAFDSSALSSNSMDKEDALSVHTVNLYEESGGYPSEPPPAYSYEEPESEKPMSAGIPFQTDQPGWESRGSSATTVPAISRLGSANQDLISGSQYGSRAGSAESGFGSALPPGSQHGSRGPSATSARSELESRAGSAISAKSETCAANLQVYCQRFLRQHESSHFYHNSPCKYDTENVLRCRPRLLHENHILGKGERQADRTQHI